MWVYLYMCGYVEKYHICGLKVGVHIICGFVSYYLPRQYASVTTALLVSWFEELSVASRGIVGQ